jgi:hypothetical protein
MAWTSDPLSEASLCGLVDIRARLNDAVESYEERIRHPENGRFPISKLSRAKAALDYIRDRLDEYITIDEENDTDALLAYVEGQLEHAYSITM